MPQVQVINTTRDKPDPTGVEEFFSRLGKDFKDREDQLEIGKILGEYQQNRQDANAWEDAQLNLERSNISPTRRLQAQNTLNNSRKIINDRDRNLNKQVSQYQRENQQLLARQAEQAQKDLQQQKTREALGRIGANEKQIDLYEIAPVGGQTKIVESIVEDQDREKTPAEISSRGLEDFDIELTRKERVKRQDARYAAQTPLVMKNSESLHGLEAESLSIGLLQELDATGRVGEGLHKLNINPKTGDLLIPEFGTAEEQLFVKTVNDFTVKAKDSFGARVTNFELDRFMQRLPTLANSKEGRALIMRQMQIVNQVNQLERRALQNVFDQYGVRNIDYADAENKARKSIESEKEELRKEYFNLEQLAKKEDEELSKKIKQQVPEGFIAMRKPNGTIRGYPAKNVPNLEEKGYKRL